MKVKKGIWFDFKTVFTKRHQISLFLITICFTSCSGLKFIPETEKLFTKSSIRIKKSEGTGKAAKVEDAAKLILRPEPNTSFLGIRFGLWWYYKTANKSSKVNKWFFKKFAQEPVYLSKVQPDLVNKALDAVLYNYGYFDSYSNYEVLENAKTATVVYHFSMHPAYRIEQIFFPGGQDELSLAISKTRDESLLKPERRYKLTRLVEERQRIIDQMKELGFYYLSENDLIFSADTNMGNRTVRLKLKVSPNASEQALKAYRIKAVNVYADYRLGRENTIPGLLIDSVNYFSEINYVKPKPIVQSVFFKNNKLYNRIDHNLTYNRLMGLGIYKYVNVRLVKSDSSSNPLLNANVFLSPLPRRSLSAEVQGVSKSNNFIGPGLSFSLKNRNAFKGAELLLFGLRTSFETQLNGPYRGKFTYELNPKIELFVPRFMAPFRIRTRSMYVPKTKFILDYSYLSRINYFDINSFKFSYGYKWKPRLPVDFDFSLIDLTYYHIGNESSDFLKLMAVNPLLKRRFEKQLIAGSSISFFYNQQVYPEKRNPLYFNVNFESSGGAISLYNLLINKKSGSGSNPLEVGNVRYAQYLKLDFDLRQYFYFGKKKQHSLATRCIAGWGLPYGNSNAMPYIKQFFSGGAYSLRGFPAFSVGPGTYSPPDSSKQLFFLQQGGEIKLEFNVEYRFPIVSVVKGALFADAGNTWLNRDNSFVTGGRFSKNFYKEMAASMGFGLRVDVQFFVLRLDMGIPVRKPWLPEGNRWVFNQFDLKSSHWRSNNLIFNLAFGYPF